MVKVANTSIRCIIAVAHGPYLHANNLSPVAFWKEVVTVLASYVCSDWPILLLTDANAMLNAVASDDIVHAELTVRENLLYSGRFTLPAGTKFEAIEELADRVLAQLGLHLVLDNHMYLHMK